MMKSSAGVMTAQIYRFDHSVSPRADGGRLTAVDADIGRPLRWAAWRPDGSWCLLVGNRGTALRYTDERLEPILRSNGLLSRDPRKVERKKYGQPGARKRFQFSKR